MCRNIRTLYNFEPPATDEEVRASSLQFVRKLTGFARPSKPNQLAFRRAVEQVEQAARQLLNFSSLTLRPVVAKPRLQRRAPGQRTVSASRSGGAAPDAFLSP